MFKLCTRIATACCKLAIIGHIGKAIPRSTQIQILKAGDAGKEDTTKFIRIILNRVKQTAHDKLAFFELLLLIIMIDQRRIELINQQD